MIARVLHLPGVQPKPRRSRRRVERDDVVEPRPSLKAAFVAVVAVAATDPSLMGLHDRQARVVRLLRGGRSRAWVEVEAGEYLLRWPAVALHRRFLTTTSTAGLSTYLRRLALGRSPDGLCLRIGCEFRDGHVGSCSERAVFNRNLDGRQMTLPWA